MKYILLTILLFTSVQNTYAGFYDSEYFEPIAGCVVAGAAMYSSAEEGDEMKQGAIGCAVAGVILWGITRHYDGKYGDQFIEEEDYLRAKLNKYEMLDKQSNKKNSSSVHFRRVQKVLPPTIDKKGQGIGPRVKEKLILIDDTMRIGQ